MRLRAGVDAAEAEREHEVVVFGATGFTGALTAEYLARAGARRRAGRWPGRNRAKLEAVRARLAEIDAALAELPLLKADAAIPASLRAMAESTRW